jgi:CRISPR-associated protein Cas1
VSTLYLDRSGMELRRDGKALAVYEDGQRRSTVPVAHLDRLVLLGTVALDSGLLGYLAEQGVGVLVLSGRNRRQLALLVGRPHKDVSRRASQYRLFADGGWRLAWSRRLVRHKLAAQARLLGRGLRERPDVHYALTRGLETLSRLRRQLAPTSGQSYTLDAIRGLEGAGAAAYFGGLTALFPPSVRFTGRNRRPPRDPVNAVLSLGYTLLHAEAVQACYVAGLDPLLGFLHEPEYGRESLAADLVEPLRPYVDLLAWQLFRDKTLRVEHFSNRDDACLLDKAGRMVFYPAYEQAIQPVRRALRRFTVKVARALPDVLLPYGEGPSR